MTRVARTGYLVALIVFAADQLSKALVAGPLGLVERLWIPVLPVFDLRYVQNFGVSLGFLVADSAAARWGLVAMTGAIASGVAVWLWRERVRGDGIALGCVLGGAMGNILDRVRLGYVFDFLDLHVGDWHPFLVFNLADAAITLGVATLLLRAFIVRPARGPQGDTHA